MNKLLQILTVLAFGLSFNVNAQNWQYVGAPYFNQTPASFESLSLPDMEIAPNGDIFVAYADFAGVSTSGVIKVAMFSGGSWTQLASPGTFQTSLINLAVKGTDYYLAYSATIGLSHYVYVLKYNGSNAWTQIGDSMLLGSQYFDLLLDNAGVPTVIGVVANTNSGTPEQVMQYTGAAWSPMITIAGSGGTVFLENSAAFDSQNALYCLTEGYTLSPFNFFTLVHKITGATDALVGDTLFNSTTSGNQVMIDNNDVPYIIMHNASSSRILAYKLNASTWDLKSDTTTNYGGLYAADLSGDGKVFFTTLNVLQHRVRYAENGSTVTMDTLNTTGSLAALGDLVIPNGSTDVYVVVQEINAGAKPDISVMKHSFTTGIDEAISTKESINVYPNPSTETITIQKTLNFKAQLQITDILGNVILTQLLTNQNTSINVSNWGNGVYFYNVSGKEIIRGKFIKE